MTTYVRIDLPTRRVEIGPHLVRAPRATHPTQHRSQTPAPHPRLRHSRLHDRPAPHPLYEQPEPPRHRAPRRQTRRRPPQLRPPTQRHSPRHLRLLDPRQRVARRSLPSNLAARKAPLTLFSPVEQSTMPLTNATSQNSHHPRPYARRNRCPRSPASLAPRTRLSPARAPPFMTHNQSSDPPRTNASCTFP